MTNELYQGDCLQTLTTLDAGIVQTCVTSPPYYGLRDYGTARWEGGSAECDHVIISGPVTEKYGICRCGAIRIDSQIGLEQSPEAYVEKLVQVFREVRRVLKDDGTLWLNIGDSYNGSAPNKSGQNGYNDGRTNRDKRFSNGGIKDLKPKDLIGIPWMVAFALRADGAADYKAVQIIDRAINAIWDAYDGTSVPDAALVALEKLQEEYQQAKGNSWYLRSEIIWHKPNPMPESVTDRPTKSHEQIFLLSRSAQYFYDADAIAEKTLQPFGQPKETGQHKTVMLGQTGGTLGTNQGAETRNKRTVWTVTTKPYSGAHFATFPPKLIEPCILAGSREGDTVLDPFNGSGTTGAVAIKHHRNYKIGRAHV